MATFCSISALKIEGLNIYGNILKTYSNHVLGLLNPKSRFKIKNKLPKSISKVPNKKDKNDDFKKIW